MQSVVTFIWLLELKLQYSCTVVT